MKSYTIRLFINFFNNLFILNCAFKRDKEVRAFGERVIACNVAVNLINY